MEYKLSHFFKYENEDAYYVGKEMEIRGINTIMKRNGIEPDSGDAVTKEELKVVMFDLNNKDIVSSENGIKKILYPHQQEAVEQILESDIGTIILPTGAGKTFIQAATNAIDMIRRKSFAIYTIRVPRIILSYQILTECYGFQNKFHIESKYLLVHSGSKVDEESLLELKSDRVMWHDISVTTNGKEIKKIISDAQRQNLPIVIIETYDSADVTYDVIKKMGLNIEICHNDECQYLVREEFEHLLKYDYNRMYSFTATPRNAKTIGMQNEELWGEKLYSMTPREAIERGIIVRPRMIYLASKEDKSFSKDDLTKSFSKMVKYDFEILNHYNPKVKNKLLVASRGSADMINFIHSKECKELIESGVHIFAIGSNKKISAFYNGQTYKRADWLRKLQSIGKNDKEQMVVIHFDILSEGIDVPGFTGISFYSAKEIGKFIQLYGRTARLDVIDRSKLLTGKISVNNLSKWKKPYSFVVVHQFNDIEGSQSEEITQMVSNLREFGFEPHEDIIIDTQNGISEKTELDNLLDEDDKRRLAGKLIEKYEIHYRIEKEKDASLFAEQSNETIEELEEFFYSKFKK
jgi:superfamily II DNA or RNA helicase